MCVSEHPLAAFETGFPATPRGLGLEEEEGMVPVVPPPTVSQRLWQVGLT